LPAAIEPIGTSQQQHRDGLLAALYGASLPLRPRLSCPSLLLLSARLTSFPAHTLYGPVRSTLLLGLTAVASAASLFDQDYLSHFSRLANGPSSKTRRALIGSNYTVISNIYEKVHCAKVFLLCLPWLGMRNRIAFSNWLSMQVTLSPHERSHALCAYPARKAHLTQSAIEPLRCPVFCGFHLAHHSSGAGR
jgi:hypothetical protein